MYTDYGPNPHQPASTTRFASMRARVRKETAWRNRPFCDLCGSFRGRYLRRVGRDEFGPIHRCRACDEE